MFILEPGAALDSSGRGYTSAGPGDGVIQGAGAGHAAVGGNGKCFSPKD